MRVYAPMRGHFTRAFAVLVAMVALHLFSTNTMDIWRKLVVVLGSTIVSTDATRCLIMTLMIVDIFFSAIDTRLPRFSSAHAF
jgi:hypothetical protein